MSEQLGMLSILLGLVIQYVVVSVDGSLLGEVMQNCDFGCDRGFLDHPEWVCTYCA